LDPPAKYFFMNIEELRNYCLLKKGTTEEFPFDQVTLVFKVMGKIYALTNLEGDLSINLKCDPKKAIALREQNPCVQPGYHMSKVHWNTVHIDGSMKPDFLKEMIDHSYELVVSKLTKKQKSELENI